MPRPVNAVDFWRGFALVSIFINHIPGIFYDRFTHKNLSLSDSAELFVFLAGWSLRHVVGRPEDPAPLHRLVFRLGGRALTLYAAHMMIVMLAIAMLAASARLLDNPLLLEWHNAAAVFNEPVETHIGLVLLSHQLGYFDILPLYVVLMLLAPLIAFVHRHVPNLLVPVSLAIYLSALIFKLTIPTWPTEGQWFFNPLCWQLVFVLGFAFSRERGPGGWVREQHCLAAARRGAHPDRHDGDGMVQLVAGSNPRAGAQTAVHRRQDVRDADTAHPVPGADRGVFRALSADRQGPADAGRLSSRCWGATRCPCSAPARC